MYKRLPFEPDVLCCAYLDLALPWSILPWHHRCASIFFTYNIQTYFNKSLKKSKKIFRIAHGLDKKELVKIGLLTVEERPELICLDGSAEALAKCFIDSIDLGKYIEVRLNEYYMPCRPNYMKWKGDLHINLVVGFDIERSVFLVAGQGKSYSVAEISFSDMFDAFAREPDAWSDRPECESKWRGVTWLWSPKNTPEDLFPTAPDITQICIQLNAYLSGLDTRLNSRIGSPESQILEDGAWGVQCNFEWRSYLERVGFNNDTIDVRATRCFWEHKNIMLERVRYLTDLKLINSRRLLDGLSEVERRAKEVRTTLFAYNLRKNAACLKDASVLFVKIADLEGPLLAELLEHLSAHLPGGTFEDKINEFPEPVLNVPERILEN